MKREPKLITCIAGQDIKVGDAVHVHIIKRHWFKRFILWLVFWHKPLPVVYKVSDVSSSTMITITREDWESFKQGKSIDIPIIDSLGGKGNHLSTDSEQYSVSVGHHHIESRVCDEIERQLYNNDMTDPNKSKGE